MIGKIPVVDTRKAKQIYEQAVELAWYYCSEWMDDGKKSWLGADERINELNEEEKKEHFLSKYNQDDIGVALLKLFSKLAEIIIGQVNRIPEKHLLTFYDFIGLDHLPPVPAKTPLTFLLSEGSTEAAVPIGTKVASADDPTVIFETLDHLTALSFTIPYAFSMNTWEDAYTDHSSDIKGNDDGFFIFGRDTKQAPMEHILFLAHDLFEFTTPFDLTIDFTFDNYSDAFEDYFHPKDLAGEFALDDPVLHVTLNSVVIPRKTIDGLEARWVSFKPDVSKPVPEEELPLITSIKCSLDAYSSPDGVLFNDSPVDIKKGFYPFGETPKPGDTLYIGCEELFSKTGAALEIIFNLKGGTASVDSNGDPLVLVWEYWSGSTWNTLSVTVADDETSQFTLSDERSVSFTCPEMTTTEINGISGRWIRVRIASGGYGLPAAYGEVKSNDEIVDSLGINDDMKKILKGELEDSGFSLGMKYRESSYAPPFISSLQLKCSVSEQPIQLVKTYNNFSFQTIETIDDGNPLSPYTTRHTERPAFYLGFNKYPENKTITLYFSLKSTSNEIIPEMTNPVQNGDDADSGIMHGLVWEYYNGSDWKQFGPEDETTFFLKSGIVTFIVPNDIGEGNEFLKECYWLRVIFKENYHTYTPPKLKAILTNTVWAGHTTIVKNELLGSSNGQANQVFPFASTPVLGQQIIEVKEPSIPTDAELLDITVQGEDDPVRLKKSDSGDIEEIWVRWREVSTFVHSTATSRHYIIDRVEGKILFGDGVHGMIPPVLPGNILALEYRTGGGKTGNQKRNILTVLKTTIPNIQGVMNYDSSSGGDDLEKADDILARVPNSLKTRDRAVTKGDFEWLAREASPQVARARCFVESNDDIKVIIATSSEDGSLYPDISIIDHVGSYLKERAFATIRNFIKVEGPAYLEVDIQVIIVPVLLSEGALVAERVERRLKEFLDPINGGYESKGWDFGEDLYFSKVAAIIENVEGVDYITTLIINEYDIDDPETTITFINIEDYQLPSPGTIEIRLSGGES